MKNTIITILSFLLVNNLSFGQESMISVQGALQVADYENASPEVGMIRYNSTKGDFEGWNGVFWVSLTGNKQSSSVTDIDGNTYKTIRIGEQVWMAENLRTTKYQNGDNIANITSDTDWINLSTGAWCWYNNDSSHEHPFGKLYNAYAATDDRNVCPVGWRVPSNLDWQTLINFWEPNIAGGKMKSKAIAHWNLPNVGASNESGFTAVGSGERSEATGEFATLKNVGKLWSSTEYGSTFIAIDIERFILQAYLGYQLKNTGLAIRCIKDGGASGANATPVDESDLRHQHPPIIEAIVPPPSVQSIRLSDVQLLQNHPNPFYDNTSISYYVPENIGRASIRITDATGKIRQEVKITQKGAGRLDIHAHALSEGQYFYSLVLDGAVYDTKQMLLER